MLIFNYLYIKKIKNNEKSKLLKQNYYGCMNSGAINTKKSLCERSLGTLIHHYFISLKGNI